MGMIQWFGKKIFQKRVKKRCRFLLKLNSLPSYLLNQTILLLLHWNKHIRNLPFGTSYVPK